MLELLVRACRHLEVTEASVPAEFPLAATRHLEQIGVSISAEPEWFANRRRAKLPREIAGTENAALATLDAMEAIRSAIHATAEVSSESLRQLAYVAAAKHGAVLECAIVSHGPQAAEIHNAGAGAIAEGESVVVDLGARDLDSGCYSDMTRTFCRGRAPAQLVEMHEICLEALEKSLRQVRVGISGGELHRVADDAIAAYGVATPLTVPGDLTEGFIHPLGHGVGLEIHESPDIEPNGQELIAGDVIALEPGIYRPGFGGCRLEDLVTVTADGGRVLTEYPYEL
jgi:Xaa-Pro aminopeptidase